MRSKRVCSFEGCTRVHYAKGFCYNHYTQQWKGKPLSPLREVIKVCLVEGCGGSHRSKGMCSKHYERLRKYGITQEEIDLMLEGQGGVCAICKADNPGGKGTWNIDHDHSCCPGKVTCGNCVRKILCMNCNQGLGKFQDNPQLLTEAIVYLERHGKVSEATSS